ncbi:hypothetical protein R1flu_003247 [Riccia fluitans]|uniref:QLQ domain-containing protein n=1 Tax=Riccia fluitans TaxID=41844 RepID=A0ABD1YBW4_9MARC
MTEGEHRENVPAETLEPAFGQDSDREQHWHLAAMKQQNELASQPVEEELTLDKGDITMTEGEHLENVPAETLELVASSFSESQQTQLRAQILIYGDLIKGVLPEHNLMLSAFQDSPEAFGQDSDQGNTSEWNWEQHWHLAAMKQQSELASQAVEEELTLDKGDITMTEGEHLENVPTETLEPGTPSTVPIKVAERSKEVVNPDVIPKPADASVARVDAPSIEVNQAVTVNLDVVVDSVVETNVTSFDSTPQQPGANKAPDYEALVGTVSATTRVTTSESFILVNEAGQAPVTRSPSLDPWLGNPVAAHRSSLSDTAPLSTPPPQSAAWQPPPHPTNHAHSSQEDAMSVPSTNVPRDDIMPNSTQYPSLPVNGEIATGVPPVSLEAAASVEEGPGSRKRKQRAGKTTEKKSTSAPRERKSATTPREKKAATAPREKKAATTPKEKTPAVTPRGRGRAKKGSAAQVVSPSTTSAAPNSPSPSKSAKAGVQNVFSPTSPKAPDLERGASQSLHTDTANWVEQARVSFEVAMSAATGAQHEVQMVSSKTPRGRASASETKFTSAADAVKVAASVAKAAADAAKVAYEAALQARLFACEGEESSPGRSLITRAEKDGGVGGRRSAIAAAKEEARKRAAGSKPSPQSTHAVITAAKLMTDAAAEASAVLVKGNATPTPHVSVPLPRVSSPGEEVPKTRGRPRKTEPVSKSIDGTAGSEAAKSAKDVKQSGKKGAQKKAKDAPDALIADAKTPSKSAEDFKDKQSPEQPLRRQLEGAMTSASNATDGSHGIVEGSVVEVMNDEEGLRGGWFSAQVLEVKGAEVYVQYDELLTDDGKTRLKEWFPLEGKMDGPEPGRPQIRLIDNMAREEGKVDVQRKRRRTATKEREWKVGDRADAYANDGWWEGVVQAVDEDQNKVTMLFPGEGDTQVVRAKNLRPSLVWKDGKWEQWIGNEDTQPENKTEEQSTKRQKTGISPRAEARKTTRQSSEVKISEMENDSARTTRRGKLFAPSQEESEPSSAVVNTRSSPRQKLLPKRKGVTTNLATPESEVSTPNQVSTPVITRARSLPEDAVNSDKEPSKGGTPAPGSASQKKSPVDQKVEKKNQSKENGETPSIRRNLRNSKEQIPSSVIETPTTRQKAKAGSSTQNQRSARV